MLISLTQYRSSHTSPNSPNWKKNGQTLCFTVHVYSLMAVCLYCSFKSSQHYAYINYKLKYKQKSWIFEVENKREHEQYLFHNSSMVTSKTLPSITPVKKIRTHRSAHSKVILPAQREKKSIKYKEKRREIFTILFYMQQAQPKAKNKKIKGTWG